jgi:hypothetical protein
MDEEMEEQDFRATEKLLADELLRIQNLTQTGCELKVELLPKVKKRRDGRQLLEEVKGNTILIYGHSLQKGVELVRHGFIEWLLNQNTQQYRLLINKLITLFEEQQYERKERIVEALTRLLQQNKF